MYCIYVFFHSLVMRERVPLSTTIRFISWNARTSPCWIRGFPGGGFGGFPGGDLGGFRGDFRDN